MLLLCLLTSYHVLSRPNRVSLRVFSLPQCKRKHMDKHIKEDPIVHLGMACDTVILHRRELELHAKTLEKHLQQVGAIMHYLI
ncbi:hypothetical protein DPMN_016017 [Dreissena polymorpha]|uniref:Uncharacterized protein n=1 Tax=Dreissena polymorpha TaxID=45954 RepID=A0A9D4N8W8_DREPO|nr:hypothetical protein DPMN_016017 [Dreissena polymorpha]